MSLIETAISWARRARSTLTKFSSQRSDAGSFYIGRPWLDGFLECAQVDPCGIIRLIGWRSGDLGAAEVPSVCVDGQPIPLLHQFRFTRTDVAVKPGSLFSQAGLALDYLIPESLAGKASTLSIDMEGDKRITFEAEFGFISPHYRNLLSAREVYHREHIYGSGPPNTSVHPEVLELAKQLEGPVLDFGCGRGALMAELQRLGVEVHGLELDSDVIRESIAGQDAKIVTSIALYDGSFPSPFKDGQFRSVICSEVLEHIPSYQSAIRDIARISTGKVVFTVPDASAIPVGFRHGAVPWHLLEGTHFNFFTQESLRNALMPYFPKIEFGRVGLSRFNESAYYVSLVAVCLKD